jgi:hypothetical protein
MNNYCFYICKSVSRTILQDNRQFHSCHLVVLVEKNGKRPKLPIEYSMTTVSIINLMQIDNSTISKRKNQCFVDGCLFIPSVIVAFYSVTIFCVV